MSWVAMACGGVNLALQAENLKRPRLKPLSDLVRFSPCSYCKRSSRLGPEGTLYFLHRLLHCL